MSKYSIIGEPNLFHAVGVPSQNDTSKRYFISVVDGRKTKIFAHIWGDTSEKCLENTRAVIELLNKALNVK